MGRVLCSFMPSRPDAASLRLAGAPPRALAAEPLDYRAQPSAIPEVRMWTSAEFPCMLQHNRHCEVLVLQLEGLCRGRHCQCPALSTSLQSGCR
jgi:hypothetical protein